MAALGGGEVWGSPQVQQGDGQVAQAGQKLRRLAALDLTGIFAKRIVPHPMQAVFNVPMVAPQVQKYFGIGTGWRKTGDGVGRFPRLDTLDKAGAFELADLACARPVEITGKPIRAENMARLDPVAVGIEGLVFANLSLPRALFRGGKKVRQKPIRCAP